MRQGTGGEPPQQNTQVSVGRQVSVPVGPERPFAQMARAHVVDDFVLHIRSTESRLGAVLGAARQGSPEMLPSATALATRGAAPGVRPRVARARSATFPGANLRPPVDVDNATWLARVQLGLACSRPGIAPST